MLIFYFFSENIVLSHIVALFDSLCPIVARYRPRSYVQMATAVAILSGHCPSWDLVAFSFDVYDFNGDGVIDFNELRDMLANSLAERGIPHRFGARAALCS